MKTSLIHLGIAALLLAFAAGAYAFGFHLVSGARTEAATLAADILAKEASQARGASARARLAEVAADEEFVALRFVASEDIVAFLEGLENVGKEYGAVVDVASVSGDTKGQGGTLMLSLSIRGSFEAVMRTLGTIEHGRYAISARDLSWSTESDGIWAVTGTFSAGTHTTP